MNTPVLWIFGVIPVSMIVAGFSDLKRAFSIFAVMLRRQITKTRCGATGFWILSWRLVFNFWKKFEKGREYWVNTLNIKEDTYEFQEILEACQ